MDQLPEPTEDGWNPEAAFIHHHFLPEWNLDHVAQNDQEDGRSAKRQRQNHFCEVCDASFTERRSLTRHLKSSGHLLRAGKAVETSYPCGYCSKSFTRHEYRLRHEREIHLGERRARQEPGPAMPQAMPLELMLQDGVIVEPEDAANYLTPLHPPFATLISQSIDGDNSQDTQLAEPLSTKTSPSTNEHQDSGSSGFASARPTESSLTQAQPISSTDDQDEFSVSSTFSHRQVPKRVLKSELFVKARSSFNAGLERRSRPEKLLQQRALLLRIGASRRPGVSKPLVCCALCNSPFGKTGDEVRAHVEIHMTELSGVHTCHICQIGFVRRADLDWHRRCASDKDDVRCGFDFHHRDYCTGHHPPHNTGGKLSDNQRMQLFTGLRNWEQAQLQSLMRSFDDALEATKEISRDCWSISAACRRSVVSLTSLSTTLSELSIESTPDRVDYHARLNMTNVRHRMVRRLQNAPRLERLQPSTLARNIRTSKTCLDALLISAVKKGDILEAQQLLRAGAAVNGGAAPSAVTPLVLAASSGYADMVSLLLGWRGTFSRVLFLQRDHALHVATFLKGALSERSMNHEDKENPANAGNDLDEPLRGVKNGIRWTIEYDLRRRSYAMVPNECASLQMFSMCPVEDETQRQELQEMTCATIIGEGDCTDDYHFPPSTLLAAYDLDDLPAAIMMCRAVDTYNRDLATWLSRSTPVGRKAYMLRRIIASDQIGLLKQVLQTSPSAVETLQADPSLLKSIAFKMRLNALDPILQHSSPRCIKAVICRAIAKNRDDVVKVLCRRTSPTTELLERKYQRDYCFDDAGIDAAAVCAMISTWYSSGDALDYRQIYTFLAIAPVGKRLDIVMALAGVGAPEALTLQALWNIGGDDGNRGQQRYTRNSSAGSEVKGDDCSSDEDDDEGDTVHLHMV